MTFHHRRPFAFFAVALALVAVAAAPLALQAQQPMSWMDERLMANPGDWTPSPDGTRMLYTIEVPDWAEASSQTDLHLVDMDEGVASSRQLTFTTEASEESPVWSPDGDWFVFRSDRDPGEEGLSGDQLYLMSPNGGEARRITAAEHGVEDVHFSPDGTWLVYQSGEDGREQLHALAVEGLSAPGVIESTALTDEPAGIEDWAFSADGGTIYFSRPLSFDEAEHARREAGFTVNIQNMETALSKLYALDLASRRVRGLTDGMDGDVRGFTVSDDGRWLGVEMGSEDRYERNITGERLYSDLWLLEIASGDFERLTENYEVGESDLSFSPDGRWIAFSAPQDLTRYTMTENKIYLRAVEDEGGEFRRLGDDFDNSLGVGFWSEDGSTIYFNAGIKVTRQLMALDVEADEVRAVTDERAALAVQRDEDSGRILIQYEDPETPETVFTVDGGVEALADRESWTRLVDANPWVRDRALGRQVEVEWTSTDGRTVGGVLTYPVGYEEGTRYPLIVSIHGGPASADLLEFNDGYGSQVYAGAGYAMLQPNYRGSRNYGNAHRTDIVGDYFTLGYDDIMTGVDHLIDEGIVDGDRMGALGWSAGGHWSNWILVSTDRFKAISSGAGTMNWISMYAQSDVQRNRRFYVGDDVMYENFEPYWEQSPLPYIGNASTPTMIHVVEGDPRVPSPQSKELHMALKKLGIPTELFLYPGQSHGIPDTRNRLVKSVSEMAWMDYYVRGMGERFQWHQVLETLDQEMEEAVSDGMDGGR